MKSPSSLLCLLLTFLLTPIFATDTLHIYIWADYIHPDLIKRFEQQHQCKVVIDTFDSNEAMYARLKAGATGYDLIFPSSYIIPLLEKEQLIQKLDHQKIPNLKNLDPTILTKISNTQLLHSAPYTISYTVIGYSKSQLENPTPTWKLFERNDLKKRATLLDDARETLGAALITLGHPANSTNEAHLQAAANLVLTWKKNLAKFDNEAYKAGLDSSEFLLVHGYSGDLWQVAQENDDIGILLPQEGFLGTCDEMVIPTTAQQPNLAHHFINFLLDSTIAAENMQWLGYICPNHEALKKVSSDFLKNPTISIPTQLQSKIEFLKDVGPHLPKYSKAWDHVKNTN